MSPQDRDPSPDSPPTGNRLPVAAAFEAPGRHRTRRRGGFGRFLRAWLLLSLVLLAVLACGLGALGEHGGTLLPLHISVDGQEVYSGLDLDTLPVAGKIAGALALLFVAALMLLLVPLAVLGFLALLLLVLLAAVGVPLLALGLVAALLASPLWIPLLIVWGVVRANRRAASPNMHA